MSANETGRTIQHEVDGPVYERPSEAEIHAANAMADPRNCDCLARIKDPEDVRAYRASLTRDEPMSWRGPVTWRLS
jgi:hypothetical protein